MNSESAISISGLSHSYGERQAIRNLDLSIQRGEIFGLLGPNGSGKTTLFRVLSTLIPIQTGDIRALDFDLRKEQQAIRMRLGVVFQAPSLDKKLTVRENIRHQAALYGLSGETLRHRESEMLDQLGLADRANELAETLSGGLRRRVELAKGMIHRPELLILDEPSTGLDPGARSDLWQYLKRVRDDLGVTIVLTTHLLEEADHADRLAILNEGALVACDTPDALRATVGGDAITIETDTPDEMIGMLNSEFQIEANVVDGAIRIEESNGHQFIARLMDSFGDQIQSVRLGKPTLEDVFIRKTGHRFWHERENDSPR